MKGSEKQIAWAEDIKGTMVGILNAAHDYQIARAKAKFAGNPERLAARIAKLDGSRDEDIEVLDGIESAKWFIDNRGAVTLASEIGVGNLDADLIGREAMAISRAAEHEAAMQRIKA